MADGVDGGEVLRYPEMNKHIAAVYYMNNSRIILDGNKDKPAVVCWIAPQKGGLVESIMTQHEFIEFISGGLIPLKDHAAIIQVKGKPFLPSGVLEKLN